MYLLFILICLIFGVELIKICFYMFGYILCNMREGICYKSISFNDNVDKMKEIFLVLVIMFICVNILLIYLKE